MSSVQVMKTGPGKLTFGGTGDLFTMQSQVTASQLVPNVNSSDPVPVLSGESAVGDRSETWTLEGSMLQDLGAEKSVVEYLFTNRGEPMPFTFVPSNAKGKQWTGTLVLAAVRSGGDVGQNATADFSFPLVGDPVLENLPGARSDVPILGGEDVIDDTDN